MSEPEDNRMTVGELIEELRAFDQQARVYRHDIQFGKIEIESARLEGDKVVLY